MSTVTLTDKQRATMSWIAQHRDWCAISAASTCRDAQELEGLGMVECEATVGIDPGDVLRLSQPGMPPRPYAFRLTDAGRKALEVTA